VIACGVSHMKENKFIYFSSIYGKVFYFSKNNLFIYKLIWFIFNLIMKNLSLTVYHLIPDNNELSNQIDVYYMNDLNIFVSWNINIENLN
jgi:hypothetical protein